MGSPRIGIGVMDVSAASAGESSIRTRDSWSILANRESCQAELLSIFHRIRIRGPTEMKIVNPRLTLHPCSFCDKEGILISSDSMEIVCEDHEDLISERKPE